MNAVIYTATQLHSLHVFEFAWYGHGVGKIDPLDEIFIFSVLKVVAPAGQQSW